MNQLLSHFNLKIMYNKILKNKIIFVCIIFTLLTVSESLLIVMNVFPAKEGLGPYVHMIGRFVLNALVIASFYILNLLNNYIKSKLLIMTIPLTQFPLY